MHFKKDNLFGKFVKEGCIVMGNTHLSSYNFCNFAKDIFWGIFWTSIFFYFAGWLLVFGLAPWIMPFFMEIPFPWGADWGWGYNIYAASNLLFWGSAVIAFFCALAYCDAKIENWRDNRERRRNDLPPKPPKNTWFSEAYKAFKEKYCPLVTFEE